MNEVHGTIGWKKRLRPPKPGLDILGRCTVKGRTFRIDLSQAEVTTMRQYGGTLLHELLHLWIFLIVAQTGQRISEAAEHRCIARVERYVRRLFIFKEEKK